MTNAPFAPKRRNSHMQVPIPASLDKGSRNAVLGWINDVAKTNYKTIEQLHTGDVYCLLNNALFPDSINLSAVKWNCRRESEAIENWRMLHLDWRSRVVNKVIPYERLVKGNFKDNYEWLQWYKPFFELNFDPKIPFDPVAMRNGVEMPAAEKLPKPFSLSSKNAPEAPKNRSATKTGPPSTTLPRQPVTPRLYITGQEILQDVDNQMNQLYAENHAMANERDYYHGKCSEVEKLCKAKGAGGDQEMTELVSSILKVLSVRDQPPKEEVNTTVGSAQPKEEKSSDEDPKPVVPKKERSDEAVKKTDPSPSQSSGQKKPSDATTVNPKPAPSAKEKPSEVKREPVRDKTTAGAKQPSPTEKKQDEKVSNAKGQSSKSAANVKSQSKDVEKKKVDESPSLSMLFKKEDGKPGVEIVSADSKSPKDVEGKQATKTISHLIAASSPKKEEGVPSSSATVDKSESIVPFLVGERSPRSNVGKKPSEGANSASGASSSKKEEEKVPSIEPFLVRGERLSQSSTEKKPSDDANVIRDEVVSIPQVSGGLPTVENSVPDPKSVPCDEKTSEAPETKVEEIAGKVTKPVLNTTADPKSVPCDEKTSEAPEKKVEENADSVAKPVTDTTVSKRFQTSLSSRGKLFDVTTEKDEGKSGGAVSQIYRSPSRVSPKKKTGEGADTANGETRQPSKEKPSDGDFTASTQPQPPKGDEHSDKAGNVETKSSASKNSGSRKKNKHKKNKEKKDGKQDEAISTGSKK